MIGLWEEFLCNSLQILIVIVDIYLCSFYSTMRSRLKVAEVLTRIQAGAQFTFDYLMLLILAAVIAFFGLTENSSVVLVASMLVSPMMGPILAGTS